MHPENELQPRAYQQNIAEAASKTNTLVVLPTGLGKTMVAMLVAKARLERFPKGKVVMLAPTKPLVLQHYETFRRMMTLEEGEAAVMTGETDPVERSYLWRRSRYVFATPQTVRNDLRGGRVELNETVLLVFDEAHRSVKDYSYTQLAQLYKEQAWNPLIMGLTASPGGNRAKVEEIMRNLYIEKVEVRSEDDEDVRPYVEKTQIEGIRVSLPPEYSTLLQALRVVYNEKVTRLVEAGFLPKARLTKTMLLGARTTITNRLKDADASGGSKGYLFGSLVNQAQGVMVLHALELLETQGPAVLERYLVRFREKPDQGRSAQALLRDPRWLLIEEEARKLRGVANPKLEKLAEIVSSQLAAKADSRVIVFTQYRDTIETIVERLGAIGVSSMRFVGQADKLDSEGMDQSEQTEALERFRAGGFSVLVSSSIGEEGLHVPDVDLVVFYEAVPSEIRSIQRKGRTGRTRPGRVVILIAEGTVDEAYYYSSISRERFMKSMVSTGQVGKRTAGGATMAAKKTSTLLDYM
ncbi:MAG: DEAD/DEAH box helicase [Nitrososphaerales archaeon]